ncbi:TPA: hypothetical protein ACQVHS_005000, partial [Serratia marcescens]
ILIIIHHPASTRPTRGLYGTDCGDEYQQVLSAAERLFPVSLAAAPRNGLISSWWTIMLRLCVRCRRLFEPWPILPTLNTW